MIVYGRRGRESPKDSENMKTLIIFTLDPNCRVSERDEHFGHVPIILPSRAGS